MLSFRMYSLFTWRKCYPSHAKYEYRCEHAVAARPPSADSMFPYALLAVSPYTLLPELLSVKGKHV